MDNPQSDTYLTVGKDALKAILHPIDTLANVTVWTLRVASSLTTKEKDRGR